MAQKRLMPSKLQIVEYWQDADVFNDGQYVHNQCFACGWGGKLERAHIKPKNQGGTDTVDNLHNLCKSCHVESEGFSDVAYWAWYETKLENDFDFGFKRAKSMAVGAMFDEGFIKFAMKQGLPSGLKKNKPLSREEVISALELLAGINKVKSL